MTSTSHARDMDGSTGDLPVKYYSWRPLDGRGVNLLVKGASCLPGKSRLALS